MRRLMIAGLAMATLLGAASTSSAQIVVERYGHWDPVWGVVPPPPRPAWRYWHEHEGDWYGHVHNCMVRFHGYDPRRDMYMEGRRWVPCRD